MPPPEKRKDGIDPKVWIFFPFEFFLINIILCIIGAVFFILSGSELRPLGLGSGFAAIYVFGLGIFTIIGVLIGLKSQKAGSILCLILGVISLISGITYFNYTNIIYYINLMSGDYNYSDFYSYGTIFTVSGSIIGLIGSLIKKRMLSRVEN
ncbi:MAG: hypothetical protein JSV62_13965 [Promethearchaeota archaeon]|nr:MAG: hypothetical protein JSV62_13965 [Candidatus Lokiarchaeota archaeon]